MAVSGGAIQAHTCIGTLPAKTQTKTEQKMLRLKKFFHHIFLLLPAAVI
jgi:hypothetical protein